MEQVYQSFLDFIAVYGYFAVALLMAMENACIPIPSELILGFAGYLIFADQMTFTGAMTAGMVGGMVGSIFAYLVGSYGGRKFVDKYGKYFLVKKSHVDLAQRWFDKYGIRAVFSAECCRLSAHLFHCRRDSPASTSRRFCFTLSREVCLGLR